MNTARVDIGLAIMLTATIAATMSVIGVTMIAAMLVIPPVIGRLLTDSFSKMLWMLGRVGDVLRVRRRVRVVLPELVVGRDGRAHGRRALRVRVPLQRLAAADARRRTRSLRGDEGP